MDNEQEQIEGTPGDAAPKSMNTPQGASGLNARDEHELPDGPKHATLYYSLARLAMLAVVAGGLYLVGARGFLLLALAFVISGLLAFVVLAPLRDAMSVRLSRRLTRVNDRIEKSKTAEDDLL